MFIGRERELNTLNELYHSNKFEFAVVYGRRRIGKTALINRFIEGKDAIFFTGVESNAKQNLENLSASIWEYVGGISPDSTFASFQAAIEYIFKLAETKRIVLVMDEYPYVARATKSLASTLQLLIDRYKDSSNLMLILCGSSMSYMEDKVLSYKAPLYGRRTAQIKLLPFCSSETCRYFTNYSPEEKALAYGIVGGTPQYILQFDDKRSIEDNIKNTFLNPMSFLYEEPVNLLKQEVREPALYTAIITAIATGASRMSEIASKVGEDANVCAMYIKNLITLGIIIKETPYGQKESHRSNYSISDNMFRFWYRFVPDNYSLIARGAADLVYSRIAPHLSEYMGKVFEDICAQYLWEQLLAGNCPVTFSSLGRWWGTDESTREQAEIDIVGAQDKNTALVAECKWTNEKVDLAVLKTLIDRSKLLGYKHVTYYLFAKNGFTQGCIEEANKRDVHLIEYKDFVEAKYS